MKQSDTIIQLPKLYDIKKNCKLGGAISVNEIQPLSVHKAVQQLSNYLRFEMNLDFQQYNTSEDMNNARVNAYIWTEKDWECDYAIGACMIRKRSRDNNPMWVMQFVWFHPYFRRKGYLSRAWPDFKRKYGDFGHEPPQTKAMQDFCKKMGDKNNG